ncbi:MAG: T9SS type A sorting domain-containing protein [Saprospiraceae bacterium]|nr:T9SS type A sorting domain-containing protein [Saprospiraceae bacterium]
MKKLKLLTIFSFLWLGVAFTQNNGGGCRKAITITTGTYILDSFVTDVATYANIFPFPDKAKWYKYTPTADGLMTISSCNGGSDTRLFIYSGTCDTLIQAGYNDDFCYVDGTSGDEYAASITKPVKANKTYYLEWDNAWDETLFSFTLSFSTLTLRANQTCETATTVAVGVTSVDSLFGYASRGDASRANWYKYTPTKNGKISLTTCGQGTDTRVWMYRGICSNLVLVNDSDDDCTSPSGDTIAVAITNQVVTAGTTYYFEWDDTWENAPFQFLLTFDAANGVEEDRLAQSVAMSPNPAQDVLNLDINFEKATDLTIRIRNNIGQVVQTKKVPQILRGGTNLDVSQLNAGIYFVELSNGATQVNKKLVISR